MPHSAPRNGPLAGRFVESGRETWNFATFVERQVLAAGACLGARPATRPGR